MKTKSQLETIKNGMNKNIVKLKRLKKLESRNDNERMSMKLNQFVGVTEAPLVLFQKVMEIPDSLILKYFEWVTNGDTSVINQVQSRLEKGENPSDIKIELAEMITSFYHGELAMLEARSFLDHTFQNNQMQEASSSFLIEIDKEHIHDIVPRLIEMDYIQCQSEFLQLIEEEAVFLNEELIVEGDLSIVLMNNDVMQIGKERSLRFIK